MDLSTIEARKALAGKWAAKYGLDTALVCSVIEQETGGTWDPFTTRYEDGFYHLYIASEVDGNPVYKVSIPPDAIRSRSTEARERAFSWGLLQIMGQTAREFGYTGRYLSALCDPDVGIDVGCRKLKHCVERHVGDLTAALLEYNGGSNPDYAPQVLARMSRYE